MTMHILNAVLEANLGVALKESRESFTATNTHTLTIDKSDKVGELLEIILEKQDDNTDSTYFNYEFSIDNETAGTEVTKGVTPTTGRCHHTRPIPGYNKFIKEKVTVTITFPGASAATRVNIFILYKQFSRQLIKNELDKTGQGKLLPS